MNIPGNGHEMTPIDEMTPEQKLEEAKQTEVFRADLVKNKEINKMPELTQEEVCAALEETNFYDKNPTGKHDDMSDINIK